MTHKYFTSWIWFDVREKEATPSYDDVTRVNMVAAFQEHTGIDFLYVIIFSSNGFKVVDPASTGKKQ